jgi:protein-tyrosine phosphatase
MRDINFEGSANFRDLGGYVTEGGQQIRWGQLYRSAELVALTDADMGKLEALGLSLIYDMRSLREREDRPCRIDSGSAIRRLHRDYAHSDADLRTIIEDPAVNAESIRGFMVAMYRRLPYEQADSIRTILLAVAAGELPLLFHCAAGKDRTGAMAALLLDLLGVPRDVIVADFILTDRALEYNRKRFLQYGSKKDVDDSVWEPMLCADPDFLNAMFHEIDNGDGALNGYLGYLGITPEIVAAICNRLLEPKNETTDRLNP